MRWDKGEQEGFSHDHFSLKFCQIQDVNSLPILSFQRCQLRKGTNFIARTILITSSAKFLCLTQMKDRSYIK